MRSDRWSDDELLVACDIYLRKGVTYDNRVRLAVLETGRSIASVKMRFGNFDFCNDPNRGLKNGGAAVHRIWNDYAEDPEGMHARACDLLRRGFVGSRSNSEMEEAFLIGETDLEGGFRECMVRRRVNQDKLRELILRYSDRRCCVTGLADASLLVASHIKPWAVCEPDEQMDVHNALCLNVFHDGLFDGYRMTVNADMEIVYDPKLQDSIPERMYRNLVSDYTCIKVDDRNRPDSRYLSYHNARFTAITGVKVRSTNGVV